MRTRTLFLLSIVLPGPAFARSHAFMPSTPPQAQGNGGTKSLTANGKIQIGYDKRADYPTIKQGVAAKADTGTTVATPFMPGDVNRGGLDGNLIPPGVAGTTNQPIFRTQPGAPSPNAFGVPAQAQASPVAAAPKQRSDSGLKGDSASRNCSATANTNPQATNGAKPNVNIPINTNGLGLNNSGNRNNASNPNGFPTNGIPTNSNFNNGTNTTNGNNPNSNSNPFGGAGFVIVNGKLVKQ